MPRAFAASRGRRARGEKFGSLMVASSNGRLPQSAARMPPNPAMATKFGNFVEMKQAAKSCILRLGEARTILRW